MPETMLEIKKNYRIYRRVYQSLFVEIAETFLKYINTLTPDEIEKLDDHLKSDGWGVQSIAEIENSIEHLCVFQMFYYFNARLPLTNGLLLVSDGETPEESEKISLKSLYEMLKDTKSHGIVSLQFLSALNIFFDGNIQTSKDVITELYKILSFKTLSGEQQTEFENISDLSAHINFKVEHSLLLNLENQDRDTHTKKKQQ